MTSDAELQALHGLRDAARDLLTLESDTSLPDAAITPTRRRAAALYADYVASYGPLNRGELQEGRPDAQTGLPTAIWRRPDLGGFRRDPDYLTVIALEVYDAGTRTAGPAPILQRRVHGRAEPIARVTTPHEALAVCLGEGGVDLDRVAGLLGLRHADAALAALGDLVYRDPERGGEWVSHRDYLGGDIRAKYAAALSATRADASYARNVEALTAVMPVDVGPLEIAVSLGAPWVSAQDIEAFVHDVLDTRVKVWHLPSAASWKIVLLGKVPLSAKGRYSTGRMNAVDLLTAGLNGRSPVVFDVEQRPGKRVRIRNVEQSLAAQDTLTALQDRFRTWVWEDAARLQRLTAEYNRRFNSHVTRRHDGSQLTFPGLADGIELWPWQRDIVAQIISAPATLCAHAVGAGKTRSIICTAMTARRLGLARKPLVAVPAHLVEQTAREARQAYPFGRFLIAGEEHAGSRAELAARCATGEWDAVIMSHATFSAIPVHPEAELAALQQRVDGYEAQIRAGKGGKFGRSVLRRRIAALEARMDRVRAAGRPSITFDDLGVDLLLIDEAHYFKRLPVVSRMAGISLGSSQRAADLMLKAQLLRARRGHRPSLALFTGTPWSNTIAETYVWQSFVQPDVLAEAGIEHFDAWAAVFVEYETVAEVTPDGSEFRLMQRPSKIRNLPELRRMLLRDANVLSADALGLDRPQREHDTIVCDPSPGQQEYVGSLGARVDKIRREDVRSEPGGDNMLVICSDGRRAALDPRLVGVAEDSPKIAALADSVARLHHEHAGVRYSGSDVAGIFQLIFCDQGTPGVHGLQTYGRIRIALAQRGVPAERVRWVHEADTGAARTALFAACRSGEVSVLIGSTDKLGVGTNVQTRLRAVHHADAPWRPSDIEQREGRALRPGNLNPLVTVLRYVTRGTFDAYMWQTLQRKAAFIEQLHRDDAGVRTVDDVGDTVLTFAEVKALATGNALLLDQAQAAADVARLRILRSIDAQTLTEARRVLTVAQRDQHRHHQHEIMLGAARERLARAAPSLDPDAAVLLAAEALRERLVRPPPSDDPAPVRAPWRGLGVELIPSGGWRLGGDTVSVRITLAHRRVDELSLPGARLRRGAAACRSALLIALRGWLADLDDRIAGVAQALADAYDLAEAATTTLREHRFDRMAELVAAEARLADITTALEASVAA